MIRIAQGMDFASAEHGAEAFEKFTVTTVEPTGGRFGGGCIVVDAEKEAIGRWSATRQKIAFGGSFKTGDGTPSSDTLLIELRFPSEGTYDSVRINLTPAGAIKVQGQNVATSITSASSGLVADDTWYWIEGYVDMAGSGATSTVKIYLDNTLVIDQTNVDIFSSLSGATFGDGGTAAFNGITLCGGGSPRLVRWDDIVVYDDDTGGLRSTVDFPLGPCRIDELAPSGAGSAAQFKPNTGANYAAVDDTEQDFDTTFVEAVVADQQDLYAFGDLGGSTTIKSVVVEAVARSFAASDIVLQAKSGSTTGSAAAQTLGNTYERKLAEFPTDPATSAAWAAAAVNAAEFGFKVA